MKARVKATGEIGIVSNIAILFGNKGYRYQSDEVEIIDSYAEVDTDADSDYWTRLEHQYAGMAMQGFCANYDGMLSLKAKQLESEVDEYLKKMENVDRRKALEVENTEFDYGHNVKYYSEG
jgi:hypothetical protein